MNISELLKFLQEILPGPRIPIAGTDNMRTDMTSECPGEFLSDFALRHQCYQSCSWRSLY